MLKREMPLFLLHTMPRFPTSEAFNLHTNSRYLLATCFSLSRHIGRNSGPHIQIVFPPYQLQVHYTLPYSSFTTRPFFESSFSMLLHGTIVFAPKLPSDLQVINRLSSRYPANHNRRTFVCSANNNPRQFSRGTSILPTYTLVQMNKA